MSVFVDTSAFVCVLDADDPRHKNARKAWESLLARDEQLVTTNYIVTETSAVLQRTCDMEAVRIFVAELVPIVSIEWIDATSHHAGLAAFLTAQKRSLSLVDCISFDTMRRLGMSTAFAYDRHFKEHGYTMIS
jgi:predicted nucleic acid-binding protein